MELQLQETRRWCAVTADRKPTPERLRQAILRGEGQGDFKALTVPGPPRDQSAFIVAGNDRELLIAIAFFDAPPERIIYEKRPDLRDTAEIYFDWYHDRIGFFQFGINPDGSTFTNTHLPYPSSHTSAAPLLRLKKHAVASEYFPSGGAFAWRCRWTYAWFDAPEVFRHGDAVGFNIARWRLDWGGEFSSWNYAAGNGGPDATAFGTLYRHGPDVRLAPPAARLDGSRLHIDANRKVRWQVVTPLGARLDVPAAGAQLKNAVAGCYRFIPLVPGKTVEPAEFHATIDAPRRAKPRDFTVSATYDFPDCVMANYYTPERLDREMKLLAGLGIQRLHWIDYSDAPSFWRMHYWSHTWPKTRRACGDMLTCAVETAHRNGLQIVTDFKVFDIGINTFFQEGSSTVPDIDGRRKVAIPEIAAHPEWTLQANPAWQPDANFPITRLRFYSKTPLPKIDTARVALRVSDDNFKYRPYRGPLEVRQGTVDRPHQRWTPAGTVRTEGAERNWYIELRGLNLKTKLAALHIDGADVTASQHGFMLVEAFGADGGPAPLTIGTTGHRDFRDDGYFFWREWPGWNNYTEPLLQERAWRLNDCGLTFQHAPNMPTLLEPTFEGARGIWLARIGKMLEAGVDGVCIRTLNHHNGVMAWLNYAFAPAVCETFAGLYGRAPEPTFEDYERIRRIRGEAFTQFLRDAKKLCAAAGKTFSVQLENGIDVPPHLDTRMQLHLDYETWFNEGIVDEASLKDWTAHSTWVHEHVLPLARRRGIPIHVTSRTFSNGCDHDGMATTPQLLTDAYRNGFAGFSFYEVQNLVELNPEGYPLPKGYVTEAIPRAVAAVRALQGR